MEGFFRSLKTEWVSGNGYANFNEANTHNGGFWKLDNGLYCPHHAIAVSLAVKKVYGHLTIPPWL